jgi:hypothetical protein
MKKTVGLAFVVTMFFGIGLSFGQEVSAEARRHFDAGRAAAAKATSAEGLLPAIWEFEEAARLAPDWPGAFRGLGMVQRAAKKPADAEKSFRRYLELAPNAADADQIRALIDEMIDQQGQDAEVQKVYRMMASDDYRMVGVQTTVLSGDQGGYGVLDFRIESGELQAWNGWAEHPDAYHPKQHPPIPRVWEPVKVNGRFYEYRYSHYMDRSDSYVVRYDFIVKGEVISTKPPRLKETVEWSVTWGAPIEGNKEPWLADYNRGGVTEHHIELVERGPKPSVGAGSPEVRDVYGRTKLHLAAIEGRRDEAGSLVAAGADVNARDNNGATPLIVAAGFGQRAVVDLLLSLGADLEARSYAGDTPLYSAAAWNQLAVVELLIEFGADVNARNKEGLTPLRAAESRKHPEMAALLRSRGAK